LTINNGLFVSGGLTVYGDIEVSQTVNFITVSDRKLKKDIAPMKNSLSKVKLLRGVYYSWVNEEWSSKDGLRNVGLIAQNVRQVLPEAIHEITSNKEKVLGIDYNALIPLLIEAIKELNLDIQRLAAIVEDKGLDKLLQES
jgi:Chaperone of endosialidase